MGQIRILSEQIANKIAAGEVIERPASVVKELLENALDAQATALSVAISHGGKSLIKVTDDGCGMDREDARSCLLRHATSKISSIEDIERIQTLGFRGEALPSIAAVSRFTLITRQHNAETGTSIRANAGAIESVKESVAAPGTAVEVADLFFNTPARKKFLKSEGAEYAAIADVFDTTALCFPGVSFCLYKSGVEVARYAASENLIGRIEQIYDAAFAQHLHPIHLEKEAVSIDGFVGTPDSTRVNRSGQKFFINRRPVRVLSLNWALDRAYEEFKERDRFPVAVLFINIDPSDIDVNVHPAKREVRLLNERFIQDILIKAIKKTFAEKGIFPRTAFQIPPGSPSPVTDYSGSSQLSTFAEIREAAAAWKAPASPMPEAALFALDKSRTIPPGEQTAALVTDNPFGIFRILGQIQGTYLVAETRDGLALIDQHAAHERIAYEEILAAFGESPVHSQKLLFPVTMHLDLTEQSVMDTFLNDFQKIGFGINDLGGGSFAIDAVPIFLAEESCARVLQDTLHELLEDTRSQTKERREKTFAAALACKTRTVKAGKRLDEREMSYLVQSLGTTQNPHTCPHGRPTIIKMTVQEIEKRFKRR